MRIPPELEQYNLNEIIEAVVRHCAKVCDQKRVDIVDGVYIDADIAYNLAAAQCFIAILTEFGLKP